MGGNLFKIAKEFNVATTTIVDFLISKGFSIENKPNAKVSDEMYESLAKEFKGSADIKEKADQIQIGTSFKKAEEKPIFKPLVKPLEKEVVKVAEKPKEEVKVVAPPVEEEVVEAKTEAPKLKILGKIDLTPKPKKQATKPEAEPKSDDKTAPAAEPEETVAEITVPIEAPQTKENEPAEIDEYRATTPQLAGLKILGKIDTDKFSSGPKGKKDKPAEVKKGGLAVKKTRDKAPAAGGPASDAGLTDAAKRKRKRKKITAESFKETPGQKGKSDGNEVKEVSKKEIDEKIKATLARLNVTGKNKRQKIRRDNREVKREKAEQLNVSDTDQKLKLTEFVSVSELASLMDVPVTEVITTCMNLGVIVSINQRLDAEVIELVANEFGHEIEFTTAESIVEEDKEEMDDPQDLEPRAPIVTVMGHVDHGKTSLLDYIRSASVASGEAGGITQHIGAYEVVVNGKKITFLDTPGHEAFTAMRARGAKITDVAIILVAADDHIMPQTKEAISHAMAAGVPIIFAINKIDKDGADPERIKQELASMNFLVEDWGGTYQSQDISAKKGINVDLLCEKILLQAEMLELKANPKRTATGAVIEASLDKGRGYVTKVLIQNGTLNIGDPIVAGAYSGKVKAMFNEKGKKLKSAGPSSPVLILGLSGAPQAGEKFKETESEQDARQIAGKRSQIEREQSNRASKRISLDEIGRRLALGTFKELNLIVKGDVDGSIEALTDSLIKLSVETIQVNVIHKAVGQISESDVLLASASDAIIIGFQVRPSSNARSLAEKEGVQIKTYSIIYEAIDEVKAAMEGLLEPTKEEKIVAQVQVRGVYKISKLGTIAGCYVMEGKISRNSHVRLIRDGIVVFPTKEGAQGEIDSLKRFKDDAKEVKAGLECGISLKNCNDIQVGDTIEAFEIIEIKQKLK
ncbi:MAG: translation initiation factor IF-2 [Saprospiraceae bacterium]|nr:translation initiation factor IF-2 [Saprospiraceae bacterium]